MHARAIRINHLFYFIHSLVARFSLSLTEKLCAQISQAMRRTNTLEAVAGIHLRPSSTPRAPEYHGGFVREIDFDNGWSLTRS